jgi:2-oxoglutarate ferredoxin oxidoreductase subunit alpha
LIINDFSITVGTVNGSGSQTSNLTILRALFKMGIPVSGKNLSLRISRRPPGTIRVSNRLLAREGTRVVVACGRHAATWPRGPGGLRRR